MLKRSLVVCSLASAAVAGCSSDGTNEPIKIGLSASLTGFDEQWGNVVRDIVTATVDELNEAGGVDGHPLELIVADDGSEPGPAVDAVQSLLDQEVVGVIGGFWSNQLEAVTPMVRDAETPLVSPSSTAPELVTNPDDGGFVFRTAPNDNFQSLAMSHYLADLANPSVSSIAIAHEDDAYGAGLAAALTAEWVEARQQQVTGSTIRFAAGLDQAGADAAWDEIVAANPTTLVVIGGGQDANFLIRAWQASGELPDLKWFLGDAAKQQALWGEPGTELPAVAEGVRGTAPTYPRDGVAFQTYVDVILERTGMDVSQEAYFPNTYDAVYLLAAALVRQSANGEEFGGAGLRDALMEVSSGGQVYHAGQWRNLVAQILGGADVDYDGAAGPVDFNADGETVSPYEVWECQQSGGAWTFAQIAYMEADELTAP
jgi:ABC-type branched-subunit amino acid transport system substrate-binding protein